jgi:hypothetical protein
VHSSDFGSIRVYHSGGQDFQQRVIDATYEIVEETPRPMTPLDSFNAFEDSRSCVPVTASQHLPNSDTDQDVRATIEQEVGATQGLKDKT